MAGTLQAELLATVGRERLRLLHRRHGWRHAVGAIRQFGFLVCGTAVLIWVSLPLVWVPVAVVQGFTVFNFTVLLHEVVHHAVFRHRRPAAERILGWLYAVPSGISATQFTRWHLDHHAELGSDDRDPKRHHLSPKRNARWYKALYATPALFVIYFRGARRESATYEPSVQARIARERRVAVVLHVSVLVALIIGAGWAAACRAYVVPVFGVFPVAFTLNRLGQHYSIDPTDPAKWTTLMRGHWFWDAVYLNSNYHLEHHYFPGVPYYRLPALQEALRPFYARRQFVWHTYARLLAGWLIENRRPHSNWQRDEAPRP